VRPEGAESRLPTELAALFQQHRHGLAGAVRGVLGAGADTQEILQEAFLKAFRAQREGRIAGAGHAENDPVGFVFVVSLNVARDARRRRQKAPAIGAAIEDVEPMQLTSTEPTPEQHVERHEAVDAARSAIAACRTTRKRCSSCGWRRA